jgi:hypothetical protein
MSSDARITTSRAGTGERIRWGRQVDPGAPNDAGVGTPGVVDSRARRVAFRTLSAVLALWLLAMGVFGLLEAVLMWLPLDTIAEIAGAQDEAIADPGYIPRHRSHFMGLGLTAWAITLSAVVQLRRPARRVGSMLLLTVLAVTAWVVYSFNGTLGEWLLEEWTWVLPVLILAVFLHPARRELWTVPGHDLLQLRLAMAAAVPWAFYGLANARLQLLNTGEHAVEEHWGSATMLAVAVAGGALIGSSDRPGWRLPAWFAAVASILFGVHSLVFPGAPSGLVGVWAVGAVAWGVAFAVATVARTRRGAAEAS